MIGTPKQRAARQLQLAERHLRRAARCCAQAGSMNIAEHYAGWADDLAHEADLLAREATAPRSL